MGHEIEKFKTTNGAPTKSFDFVGRGRMALWIWSFRPASQTGSGMEQSHFDERGRSCVPPKLEN